MNNLLKYFGCLVIMTSFSLGQVTVDGYAFLDGQADHSGIRVIFVRNSPSYLVDTIYTDTSGYYSLNNEVGNYSFNYSKYGYYDNSQNDLFISQSMTVPNITLSSINGLFGHLSGTLVEGSYNVVMDVYVAEGDTLIIEPGVTMSFGHRIQFDIYGLLIAEGLENDSIRFTSLQQEKCCRWHGIRFFGEANSNSTLSFCRIEKANVNGIYIENSDPYLDNITIDDNNCGVYLLGSNPTISNSNIIKNDGYGIYCDNSNPSIHNAQISDNNTGIYCLNNSSPLLSQLLINGNWAGVQGGQSGGLFCSDLSNPTLNDVVISGNTSNGYGGGIYIYNSSPIFNNVMIEDNIAIKGGGIYLEHDSNPQFTDVIVRSNGADLFGGGIFIDDNSSVIFQSTTIDSNYSSNRGGGVYCYNSNLNGTNVIVSHNSTSDPTGSGGGLYLSASDVELTQSEIRNNSSTSNGGGLRINSSNIMMAEVTISENYSSSNGGGMYLSRGTTNLNFVSVTKNFAVNQGGGINNNNMTYLNLTNVNICDNNSAYAGGVFASGIETISNTIIANNIGGGLYESGQGISVNYSNFWNNSIYNMGDWVGLNVMTNANGDSCDYYHNIMLDPSFIDPTIGDYRLNVNSPAIDAGDPNSDIDPDGSISDMGAFYFNTVLYTPFSDFSADPQLGNPPFEVNFTDLSQLSANGTPIESWLWDFGDDNNSSEQNPLHTFQDNGLYTVSLTIIDTLGFSDKEIKEDFINVTATEIHNLDIAISENLQHLITHAPRITFNFYNSEAETQTQYHILVSTDSTFSIANLWNSGEIASSDTSVVYAGDTLEDGQTYYLRAKVASGAFWSDWSKLSFRMNSEPTVPMQVSLINDAIATGESILMVNNGLDAEDDTLTYDFRLYTDEELTNQLDSAIAVLQGIDETSWTVSTILQDNERFWWTVQAFDGYEYSLLVGPESFLVNSENDTPGDFSLLFPIANEETTSQTPLLRWEPAFDPDPLDTVSYVLYFDTPDPGVETFDVGTDTSYQVVDVLLDNTNYSWKVICSDLNGANVENTGGYQSFRVNTENDLPTAFNLLAPEDESMVVDLTPTLVWEPSSDPDDSIFRQQEVRPIRIGPTRTTNSIREITAYQVYLDVDSLFIETVAIEVLDPEYTPTTDLLENMVYYWKIEAVDDVGGTLFSGRYSFWTNAENEAPTEFSLLAPVMDEVLTVLSPTFTWTPSSAPDMYDGIEYVLVFGNSPENMDSVWTGTDTSLTLGWELEDNQTYYWLVFAEDWSGLMTFNSDAYQSFSVNTSNDLPLAFELLYPAWEEMVTNLQPEFLWEASSDPDDETIALRESGKGKVTDRSSNGNNSINMITGYDFYLGTDSMLTDVVAVEVLGTSYTPDTDLTENQMYYWSVSAIDDSGGVTFSDTTSFWTNAENEAPTEFSLLAPVMDEVLTVLSPTFTWTPSSDPDMYDGIEYVLVFGNSPENMDSVWTGTDTSLTLDWELDDNTTYYWSVFAEDWSGLVTFNTGGYQSFTVNMGNDNPSVVDLVTPDSVMVLSLFPEMFWTQSSDPDPGDLVSYKVHWWGEAIDTDSTLIDTNAMILPRELEDNTQYFWEVTSMDQTDGISYSEQATFWTDLEPEAPLAYALLSPADRIDGLLPSVVFEWEVAADPDPFDYATYRIEITTDSTFNDITYETNTGIDPGFAVSDDLLNDTEYWWRVIAIDTDSLTTESEIFKFTVGYVAIAEEMALPTEYVLDQNFPNPFNPSTTLRYGLPEDGPVSLVIYDIRGNTVRTIESANQTAGWYEHTWNGMDDSGQPVSTGLYLTRLQAGSYTKTIKMLYLK